VDDFNHSVLDLQALQTKAGADTFRTNLQPHDHILIAGANPEGLRLAISLRDLDIEVTVLEKERRIMFSELDQIAAKMLEEEMAENGISIICEDEINEITAEHDIQVVQLKSGKNISCNKVILSQGIGFDLAMIKTAGIKVQHGIIVNEYLQTSDPGIFAIGASSEYHRKLFQNGIAQREQATVLANYFNGNKLSYYQGSLAISSLKINGLPISALGIIEVPLNDDDYEEVFIIDRYQHYYKKCIIHKDKLVGAILFGDTSELEEFKESMIQKTELGEKRQYLLRGTNNNNEKVSGKLVCTCKNIGEGNLVNVIRSGCGSLAELCKITGAGLGCGSCKPELKMIWDKTFQTA
jgi:ferredoxin-nitrate reductase